MRARARRSPLLLLAALLLAGCAGALDESSGGVHAVLVVDNRHPEPGPVLVFLVTAPARGTFHPAGSGTLLGYVESGERRAFRLDLEGEFEFRAEYGRAGRKEVRPVMKKGRAVEWTLGPGGRLRYLTR